MTDSANICSTIKAPMPHTFIHAVATASATQKQITLELLRDILTPANAKIRFM